MPSRFEENYTLSRNAKMTIDERFIPISILHDALYRPEKILISRKNSSFSLNKKIYFHEKRASKRLLLVFIQKTENEMFIEEIIDTNDIEKYF